MIYLIFFCRFFINCKEYYLFIVFIVISLFNIVLKIFFYLEIDWDIFFDRKKIYKFIIMYKIYNNCVLKYLF